MTKEQALEHLNLAITQDRERFFKLADPLIFQPKYQPYLEELEAIKQQWRDITKLPGYPDIDFPLALPSWFPQWQFMTIVKGETLKELMEPIL